MDKDIVRILDALDLRSFDCTYCDIRIEDTVQTEVLVKNHELIGCDVRPSTGAFLRVFNRGRWFYCATTELERLADEIRGLISQSTTLCASKADDGVWSSVRASTNTLMRYAQSSPADVPAAEKVRLAMGYAEIAARFSEIRESSLRYSDLYRVKHFASSNETRYVYDQSQAGFAFGYTMRDGDGIFQDLVTRWSEDVTGLVGLHDDVVANMNESRAFIHAGSAPAGGYRVVLDSLPVGVFAHESFGHKSEADFMIGDSNAMNEWKIGSKVASDVLSIVDDGSRSGTSGYCPFDDEGTPAKKNWLIRNGVLTGRLHSRRTANEFKEEPTGNARAINFEYEPIVRMTSTWVEPGEVPFAEMISQIKEGIFVKDIKHGSGLSTFTLAPRKSWWIRDGELAEPVRVAVISGSVFETLKDVEVCAREFRMASTALGGCGKMEQWPLPVAFGGPPMQVRRMQIS